MYDISILVPAIRTHMWKPLYDSAVAACKKYSFELVLVSPFELPEELQQHTNITLIKDYGCPTRAAQIGALHCKGKLIYHCVDDGVFFPDAIDVATDFYNECCEYKDTVNMRYREGSQYSGPPLPESFWYAYSSPELRLPGIDSEWKIALHFLISREYFLELGGWDCQFEYLNHSLHDLMFRIQANGGVVYSSPVETINCDHMPNRTGDHGPIHDAQTIHDAPIFHGIYKEHGAAAKRIVLDFDNWKSAPELWERRFGTSIPTTYSDLLGKK